jgi:hypothetical protein
MIQETDQFLLDWITGIVGGTTHLIAPDDTLAGNVVSLSLLEATPTLPPRNVLHQVMQIKLTYLVTIYYEQEAEAHHQLGELLFAAMEHANIEPIMEPIPLDVWVSLRAKPRPAFRFYVYIQRERARPRAKPVLKPLVLEVSSITDLYGQVLSESDMPIMGAVVESPELGLYAKTNAAGRFHFAGVPKESYAARLRIRTKKRVVEAIVDKPTTAETPYVIRVDPLVESVR